ncbi:hypothetical protein CW362_11245 [Streptomyces populi]|uniref:Uncharacterized protein n=1 Tax=Streptomyces populi TaxID=2058924 RepID=A0A2I0SSF9_9ACTN|nr:hypothetical protein CW362_11245 [Streptomyces populi]
MRSAERSVPERIRRERWHAAAWTLLGLALSAVAAVPGSFVPGRVAAEAAFEDARPCAGGAAARDDGASCLRTIRGTVISAGNAKSGKATVFRVMLRPPVPAPADQPIDLDAHGDLSERIEPGERVSVTTWRDDVVAVSQDGVRERLSGLPDEDPIMLTGAALVCVWSAVLAFIAAFGSARRARRLATGRPVVPRIRMGAKSVPVVVVPLVAAFTAGHFWDTWTAVVMTVVVWALIAVPATILALRWDREPSSTPLPGERSDARLTVAD